jgi:hypothetical protein
MLNIPVIPKEIAARVRATLPVAQPSAARG